MDTAHATPDHPHPAASVVVPVYNSAATLERAVRSVLAQSLQDFELLIVDDGSTDGSRGVAETLAAADPRIRILAMAENGGKPRAMNHAARVARGRWIAVLDADDAYHPGRLATLIAAGEAGDFDLVADNQRHLDDATGRLHRAAFTAPGDGRAIGLADFIAHSDPAAAFDFGILKPVVRRDFLARTGLAYDEDARLAEDFYFLLHVFLHGGRGYLVHAPLYDWTLPFSPTARRWTMTGAGAWRYDYRRALRVNARVLTALGDDADPRVRALLARRDRDYRVMIAYLDAQRALAERAPLRAAATIARHPHTWPLLGRRVAGRLARALRGDRRG